VIGTNLPLPEIISTLPCVFLRFGSYFFVRLLLVMRVEPFSRFC
jgi:hypothetical protein